MHQPQVARLTTLVLALVVAAPVVCAARTALLAGAFLVEFLTHGRPAALSAVTDLPVRRPFPLGGASADLYVHAGLVPGSPLILVHGLSPEGKDDPRLQDVATLLARAGLDVVVPTIPGLTHGRLGPEDVEPVVAALDARAGKAAIIGVSVGAGPALLSAADPRTRDRVSVVLSLGGYASARETVRFWLTGSYAYDGVRGRVDHDPTLVRMFVAANADRLDPGSRARLEAGDRDAAARLLDAPPPELERYFEALSPLRVASQIRARLILVHGRADRAVPYTESLRLAAARPDRTILVLVGLVGHVETAAAAGSGWSDVRDLFTLWRAMYALLAASRA